MDNVKVKVKKLIAKYFEFNKIGSMLWIAGIFLRLAGFSFFSLIGIYGGLILIVIGIIFWTIELIRGNAKFQGLPIRTSKERYEDFRKHGVFYFPPAPKKNAWALELFMIGIILWILFFFLQTNFKSS